MPGLPGGTDLLVTPPIPAVVQTTVGGGAAIAYSVVYVNEAGQDGVPSPAFTTPPTNASPVNNIITWVLGPGVSQTRILKNGQLLTSVGPGVTSYTDTGAITAIAYTASASNPPAFMPQSSAPLDGQKATYMTTILGLLPGTTPQDILTIAGSGSASAPGKIIKVVEIKAAFTETTAGDLDLILLKRSTAPTGGTFTTPTPVPCDANDPAATAVVTAYTVNPTGAGTLVGNMRTEKLFGATVTGQPGAIDLLFGQGPMKCPTLRTAAQVLALNLNGVAAPAGASMDLVIVHTEE